MIIKSLNGKTYIKLDIITNIYLMLFVHYRFYKLLYLIFNQLNIFQIFFNKVSHYDINSFLFSKQTSIIYIIIFGMFSNFKIKCNQNNIMCLYGLLDTLKGNGD